MYGGVCALVLDHVFGEIASQGWVKPLFTVKYLRGNLLGALCAEAFVGHAEEITAYVRGYLSDIAGIIVEAEKACIEPAWVREAE